jgi:hypothetical protein
MFYVHNGDLTGIEIALWIVFWVAVLPGQARHLAWILYTFFNSLIEALRFQIVQFFAFSTESLPSYANLPRLLPLSFFLSCLLALWVYFSVVFPDAPVILTVGLSLAVLFYVLLPWLHLNTTWIFWEFISAESISHVFRGVLLHNFHF